MFPYVPYTLYTTNNVNIMFITMQSKSLSDTKGEVFSLLRKSNHHEEDNRIG